MEDIKVAVAVTMMEVEASLEVCLVEMVVVLAFWPLGQQPFLRFFKQP